jgi:hypothetical protein
MGQTRTKMDRIGLALGLALLSGSALAQGRTNNFTPLTGAGQSIAATTTSASITFAGESLNQADLWIFNAGTDYVFCRWGVGAQTATTAGTPFPSGSVNIVSRNGADTLACRANTTTATVYIMPGNGF